MKPLAIVLFALLAAQAPAWAHGDVADQVKVLQQQQPSNARAKRLSCLR